MGNSVGLRLRTWIVCLGLLYSCSVYDPQRNPHPDGEKDGGADFSDASFVDAEQPDADSGKADAAVDDDAGGGDLGPCRVNPDEGAVGCPEICPEVCNGRDDDCDGRTDESSDRSCAAANAEALCQAGECFLSQCLAEHRDCDQSAKTGCEVPPSDPNNCGSCGRVCNIANASEGCDDGTCVVAKCDNGFADCDTDRASCETRTNTLINCAGCGTACKDVPHAQATCEMGFCGVASCNGGYGDCDKQPGNGCEQSLDSLAHCGGCNVPCSKASCGGGICTAADCTQTPGFADCDRDEASCETNLRADANNCGACGFKCQFSAGITAHASAGCDSDGCAAVCEMGYGDCDGNFSNGCEQPLNTLTHCGGCGQACAISNANATCSSGSCSVQTCKADYADCNADHTSCETPLNTPSNCGTCGMVCNLANSNEGCGGTAAARVCNVASCEANWADCDATAANGCERDVRTVASGGLGPCLPDASCTKASNGGHDYYFCPTARTWADARSRCQLQLRGDLARVNDATEDNFLKARITAANWIGHTDSILEGLWIWADNRVPFWRGTSSGSALNSQYVNWAPGEPNASGNCGVMYTSGQFDDANCSSTLPFICESGPDDCPSDSSKSDPGQCGCGMPDTDSDSDGFAVCRDGCPADVTKQSPGVCGCNVADADSDGDGTLNCNDGCPDDGAKQSPGACGCGTSDANSDGDGRLDCQETCDNDATKFDPGSCGCGKPDVDSDGDGELDCNDGCPADGGTTSACFPFAQSNFNPIAINFSASPASTTLNCGTTTVNTSTTPATIGNWCGTAPTPIVQQQSGGPDVVILPLRDFTLASGATLRITGSRPLILAVRGNATINGLIDANASGSTPGGGGNWSCVSSVGANGGGSASFPLGGGGGGGGAYGTAGGRGGQGDGNNNYGNGGSARGNTNLSPLLGGCPGGFGGGCSASSAAGGGGGGAIQITASGLLDVNGTIRANGGDGANGCSSEGGGAGGGSGGAILLEGGTRDTSGATITANGGSGGDGTGPLNGNGGGGSSSSSNNGSNGGNASGAGGGGGGGYGRIKR